MKKREKIIFIVLVCLCLLFPIRTLSADSGWDGGYDSGGSSSSDWGSSSSDWGSSSSYGTTSGNYSGDSLDPLALAIAFSVIIFVFIITTRTSSRTMVASTTLGKLNH